jgi:hypothetical protein
MANLLEIAGRETLSQLDYVGSLNIQLWATLRGMRAALPLVGNRHRWRATVHQMLDIGVEALPMVALLAHSFTSQDLHQFNGCNWGEAERLPLRGMFPVTSVVKMQASRS